MGDANLLRKALTRSLGPVGFSRRRNSWIRRNDEIVEVINLQKSQWSPQYYLNFGFWLRSLGEELFPRTERCHINGRVNRVVPSGGGLVELLDLASDIEDAQRSDALVRVLVGELVPFVDGTRTEHGLRSHFKAGRFESCGVHVRARPLLEGHSRLEGA